MAIDGFRKNKIHYKDTDSVYIDKSEYELLQTKSFIGKDLDQSKNVYRKGGILYGLFLAPKVKYCIVIDENCILSQKNDFQKI